MEMETETLMQKKDKMAYESSINTVRQSLQYKPLSLKPFDVSNFFKTSNFITKSLKVI